MDAPEIVEINEVRDETPTVKTFILDKKIKAEPGQFAMLWMPDVAEKPFSFSRLGGNIEFTLRAVGSFTQKLFNLKKGKVLGVRGPYGGGYFRIAGERICVVAGGVGLAPLMPLIDRIIEENKKVDILFGAATEKELFWLSELKSKKNNVLIATDDGTCGKKGSVCDILRDQVAEKKFDQIYTCGPELMMKKVADLAVREKIPCQVSLERYMKCGVGICGQCCIDPAGLRVCKDGPVFSAKELQNTEFGKYRRDASGSRCSL